MKRRKLITIFMTAILMLTFISAMTVSAFASDADAVEVPAENAESTASDESKVTCETFIPGFSGDLYGTDPVVEFYAYLSPSKKFDTLDQLRDCINDAARRAQEYFA